MGPTHRRRKITAAPSLTGSNFQCNVKIRPADIKDTHTLVQVYESVSF